MGCEWPAIPKHWGLAQALFSKISWSTDFSMGSINHPNWHAGPWAGARVDMISLRDMGDTEGWKDITEETFRGLAKRCIRWIPDDCECAYCQKCRQVYEEEETPEEQNKITVNENAYPKHNNDVEAIHSPPTVNYNEGLSRPAKPSSALERTPEDVLDLILSHVGRESLPNCVYLSSHVYPIAIKRLYYRVQLMSDSSTRNFAQTLISRPILKDYVRQLLTVIAPHWESVAVLHGILKQLPYLTLLEIGPSWITYGDLPYWEYPFKLEGLKWGLIKDKAAKKFIESQSGLTSDVVYWALPRW
jgi:hypothetical protein